ncbi:MAG: hypothetical protein H0V51_20560 [Chloroflexi bacterium]|nr:hypothetical protein [Chloroflexota bacterium]
MPFEKRPIGERASDEDDVEGHSMKKLSATGDELSPEGASRSRASLSDEDDVEGHSMRLSATGDVLSPEGASRSKASLSDEDDVEGHSSKLR